MKVDGKICEIWCIKKQNLYDSTTSKNPVKLSKIVWLCSTLNKFTTGTFIRKYFYFINVAKSLLF